MSKLRSECCDAPLKKVHVENGGMASLDLLLCSKCNSKKKMSVSRSDLLTLAEKWETEALKNPMRFSETSDCAKELRALIEKEGE